MTASRPTAASATDVRLGGMFTSSRLGSTMRPGRSTVSSFVRNACTRCHAVPDAIELLWRSAGTFCSGHQHPMSTAAVAQSSWTIKQPL